VNQPFVTRKETAWDGSHELVGFHVMLDNVATDLTDLGFPDTKVDSDRDRSIYCRREVAILLHEFDSGNLFNLFHLIVFKYRLRGEAHPLPGNPYQDPDEKDNAETYLDCANTGSNRAFDKTQVKTFKFTQSFIQFHDVKVLMTKGWGRYAGVASEHMLESMRFTFAAGGLASGKKMITVDTNSFDTDPFSKNPVAFSRCAAPADLGQEEFLNRVSTPAASIVGSAAKVLPEVEFRGALFDDAVLLLDAAQYHYVELERATFKERHL